MHQDIYVVFQTRWKCFRTQPNIPMCQALMMIIRLQMPKLGISIYKPQVTHFSLYIYSTGWTWYYSGWKLTKSQSIQIKTVTSNNFEERNILKLLDIHNTHSWESFITVIIHFMMSCQIIYKKTTSWGFI